MSSESFYDGSGCGTPRHPWRSVSFSGRSSERGIGESSSARPASIVNWQRGDTIPEAETEGNSNSDLSRQTQLLVPPLQSLYLSRRDVSEHQGAGQESKVSKLGRGRNGLDIKLDLGAVQDVAYQENEASEPSDSEIQHKREKMARCEKECSRIRRHLYFGGSTVAQDYEILRANKITHILNCVGYVCGEYFPGSFQYKTLWLQDSPSEDILSCLYDVFDFFEEVREQGGRVYVHCCQGVSRSASFVIAYLMWREGRQFEEAFQDVKALRSVTSPNMGFVFQLLQWQTRIQGSPKQMSLRMYRVAPHSPYDALHLVLKSVSSPGFGALDSRGAFVLQLTTRLYVWQGVRCGRSMAAAAGKAAFQLIRYERAQGPIITVREGDEPCELYDALMNAQLNSEDSGVDACREGAHDTNDNSICFCGEAPEPGGVRLLSNRAYNVDFEAFDKAKSGEVLPAIADSTSLRGWDGN